MRKRAPLVGLSIFFSCTPLVSAGVNLTLDADSVNLVGGPGTTFTVTGQIQNDTPYYIIPDSTDFLMPNSGGQVGGAFGIETGSDFGAYTDYLASNVTDAIAPGATFTGEIGTYTLSDNVTSSTYPTAPNDPVLAPGQSDGIASGDIDVSYDSFDSDPFTASNPTQIGGDLDVLAPATISVPEPSAALMVAMAGILLARKGRAPALREI